MAAIVPELSELSSSCSVGVGRAYRNDEAVWTFIEDLTAFSPMRVAVAGSST